MLRNSVVTCTGQFWKLAIATVLILVGSIAPVWPATGLTWTTGTVLAVLAFAAGCAWIRCPVCSNRWFFDALLRPENYTLLLTRPRCPACEREFASDPQP